MAKISPHAKGPSVVMAFKPDALKNEKVAQAIYAVLDDERGDRPTIKHWREHPQVVNRMAKEVIDGEGMPQILYFWDRPDQPGVVTEQNCTVFYFYPLNEHHLVCNDYRFVTLYTMVGELPVTEFEKISCILDKMKKVVNILQPEYAVIDLFAENIKKRKGRDLRQFGWGGILFGHEMVEKVGREKIMSCPQLLIKEEFDWGGIWTQTWANPFITDWRLRQDTAKWLGLKEHYGETVEAE